MARDCNGTTDRLDYTKAVDLSTTAHSFFGAFRFDVINSHSNFLACFNRADNTLFAWLFYVTTSGTMIVTTQYGGLSRTTSTTVSTGAWMRLAFTYDASGNGTGIHIYKNGVECSYSAATNGSVDAQGGLWSFMGRSYDNLRNVDGQVADLGILNRVATSDEIAANAAGSSPWVMTSGNIFAPSLAANTYNDPISAQAGTADGTSDYAHPNTYFPAVHTLLRRRRAA